VQDQRFNLQYANYHKNSFFIILRTFWHLNTGQFKAKISSCLTFSMQDVSSLAHYMI